MPPTALVVVGASAGGVEALRALVSGVGHAWSPRSLLDDAFVARLSVLGHRTVDLEGAS